MAYNQQQQQQQQQQYRQQQQPTSQQQLQQQQYYQQQQQSAYAPPHQRPGQASSSSSSPHRVASGGHGGMEVDQHAADYVFFDRHPELYDSLRPKANECRMRLELWYKDGVEGAVQRRERWVLVLS
jgi:hypothetical protein